MKLYCDFNARKSGDLCSLRRLKEFWNSIEGIVIGEGQDGHIIFFRNIYQF